MADLGPTLGTEPGKIRPVLVVQTDILNNRLLSTLVCPLTTQINPAGRRLRVHLSKGQAGLKKDSDVMVDQLRAIDNRRLMRVLGTAPESVMRRVSESLANVLDLVFGRGL